MLAAAGSSPALVGRSPALCALPAPRAALTRRSVIGQRSQAHRSGADARLGRADACSGYRSIGSRAARQLAQPPRAVAPNLPGTADLPSAPILIPEGPWTVYPEAGVTFPKGFRANGMYAELRLSGAGKADLALVTSDTPASSAGCFTTNVMCAAPVTLCKQVLAASETARAVAVNAGQANAATGAPGDRDAVDSTRWVAEALSVDAGQVLVASTGVIGKRIRMEQYEAAVPKLAASLAVGDVASRRAAVAITTTDLAAKSAALEVDLGSGRTARLGGMAKGSGMIHPNMATMLAVVTCDAPVAPAAWRQAMSYATARSFNQITVDGDTSTNDSVIGLANGAAGGDLIADLDGTPGKRLRDALTALLQGLAKSIAWDGEGATMLLECTVSGAPDDAAAATVAKSIVGSSLVKAAMFGANPNWGRIACAAGYSGIPYRQEDVRIQLGSVVLMEAGQPLEFDFDQASTYLKDTASAHGTAEVKVSIGSGPGTGVAWGCDLSYEYVKINVEYS